MRAADVYIGHWPTIYFLMAYWPSLNINRIVPHYKTARTANTQARLLGHLHPSPEASFGPWALGQGMQHLLHSNQEYTFLLHNFPVLFFCLLWCALMKYDKHSETRTLFCLVYLYIILKVPCNCICFIIPITEFKKIRNKKNGTGDMEVIKKLK
jgi:hypothetical protein